MSLRALLTVLVLAFAVPLVAGCRMVTPAELKEWGTRTYAGTTRGAAFKATLTAVRSQGYDIASLDPGAGQIKTAPKVMVVVVSGNEYSAAAASNSIAWDFDITQDPAGITIHAVPRGYSAGQAVPTSKMSAGYMKKAFETIFDEIERDLGVAAPAPRGKTAG